jgi:hypothetical protein
VDPVPDPLLLRKSGSAGNRTRISVSVARNSDHYTTEAVIVVRKFISFDFFSFSNILVPIIVVIVVIAEIHRLFNKMLSPDRVIIDVV